MDSDGQKEEIFEQFVNAYQAQFFEMISKYEPSKELLKDAWTRNDKNGYGLSCIIQDGEFFEKAGVNTTRLTIPLSAGLANQMKERAEKSKLIESLEINNLSKYVLYANGVSLVVHPINPFIPTVHANFRFLRVKDKETGQIIDEWFGGGCDLTPNYLFNEDAKLYHQSIRDGIKVAAPENGLILYEKYKIECDKYFYNKHRNESRGIGGVFFDDFHLNDSFEQGLGFASAVAQSNLRAYATIIERRKDTPYDQENVRWRQYRRGRYVEFNLVYDRGTKFGLMTPEARIESILMSLPLIARWEYNYALKTDSEEARLVEVLQNPVHWADVKE